MSYIGNTPTTQSFISGTDYFNGNGSTTAFTLSRTVASVNDIQAVVNNVVQVPNDAYTISGTTITFTSAPSAGTQNVYVRYLSTTTQAITPSQNTVSWNTLDSNVQGDLGISFKNRIINSNMVIDQRNAGASLNLSATGQYTVDRWQAWEDTDGTMTAQQSSVAPTGFTNSLVFTTGTADASLSATQFCATQQRIEGFNVADLGFGTAGAKTITLSFWVRSSLTGTFGGGFRNGASNRSYAFTYTISAANTWEQKSVTIAGDTSGTWLTTNGIGLTLTFGLGVGSDYSGSAGSWQSSDFFSATGAVSVIGTAGATFYITGVQLEVGTQATTFTTAGGSYGAEYALCQRYYFRNNTSVGYTAYLQGSADSTTSVFLSEQLPVRMRANPTFAQSGMDLYGQPSGGVSIGAITNRSNQNTASILIATTGASVGTGYRFESSTGSGLSGYVEYSAEL